MSKRLFILFSGAIVLLLFASAGADAQPLYRSNLVCNIAGVPIAASGFTTIQKSGDVTVNLGGLSVAPGTKFSCTVFCPLTGTNAQDPTCGDRPSTHGVAYTTRSRGLAKSPPLSAICAEPSVEVFDSVSGVFCESGFVTPDP